MTESPGVQQTISPPAALEVFGAPPQAAEVLLIVRSQSWRVTRGLLALGIGVGLTPVVAMLPPHLPWALASLIGGILIGRNRFRERLTLQSVTGICPRCEHPVDQRPERRLREQESVICQNCGESLRLEVSVPGS